jgi:hypothetical protein
VPLSLIQSEVVMKPVLSFSLTLILLSATASNAQEFPVVGDWANKGWGSNWDGQIPSAAMWADIDSLYFNWLKVNLEIGDTTTEAILDHDGRFGYSFIVDRGSWIHPYRKCSVRYAGSTKNHQAFTNFLARYVRGSLLYRLHPETGFDYVIRNVAHGEPENADGATDSDFLETGEGYNAIRSTIGQQTQGIVAEYPTADSLSGDPLINTPLQYIEYVTIRAKIEDPPITAEPVYTIQLWYKDGTNWILADTITFESDSIGTSFGTVSRKVSLSDVGGGMEKDVRIYWHGLVTATLDWVELASECSHEVLRSASVEADIRTNISWYTDLQLSNSTRAGKVKKLFTTDEASYNEFYNLNRVNALITEELGSAVKGFSFFWDGSPSHRYRWGYYNLSGIDEMSVTGFAFAWDSDPSDPIIDDGVQTADAQIPIEWASTNLRALALTVRDGDDPGKVFWPTVQTHGETQTGAGAQHTRFPKHEELRLNIGLGLSYGAKGVVAHLVSGTTDYVGLIGDGHAAWPWRDETADSLGNKFNPRLRGDLGMKMLDLRWNETYEAGSSTSIELNDIILQNNNAYCNGLATHPVGTTTSETAYMQVSDFSDDDDRDYLFLVNRRTQANTLGDRTIKLSMINPDPLFLRNFESHEIEVIPQDGVVTTMLPAGDFCLLEVEGGTRTEPLVVDNVMYIRSGATYSIADLVTVTEGAHIYIEDGAELRIENDGELALDGGTIVFEGSGLLRLDNPSGLTGSGTLQTPNIEVSTDLVIPSGADLTMEGCGTFTFDDATSGSSQTLHVLGTLRLRGSGCLYVFDQRLDDILVSGNGLFDVYGTDTLAGLPHVNITESASLIARGESEVSRCHLKFRDRQECNTQSLLRMEYVTISGLAASDEWEGILVAGNAALCDLSHVDITDVYCNPVYQGSGVHFYEAAHSQNRISNCNILRQNKADKKGDGIFLQPGAGTSYVDIRCSTTGDDWWTGVTTVSSEIDIIGLEASGNLRGLGAHLDGTVVEMQQSILNGNAFEGVFADNSDISLGKWGDGLNLISQNGDIQIDLTQGSRLLQISSQDGCGNDIGHTSSTIPRVRTDGTSIAQSVNNYWLTGNPDPGMFPEVNQGSIDWNPYLPTSAVAQATEWECNILQKRSAPLLTGTPTRSTLSDYARAGRMTEVYSVLEPAVSLASTSPQRMVLLRELMRMELIHARSWPDSVEHGRARLTGYLARVLPLLPPSAAPEMLALQATYYTFAGYPDSADTHFDMLARSYGNTAAYRNSLHARWCNSFIKLDSAAIDETIIAMNAAGLDSSSLRLARTERRAYYRCRNSNIMPKRQAAVSRMATPDNIILMSAHPNPGRKYSEVTITLPEAMDVRVTLLTMDGRELRTLFAGGREAGVFTLPVDLSGLQSGVYLCAARAGAYSGSTRIITLK